MTNTYKVPCPSCGAAVGERCHRRSGKLLARAHAERVDAASRHVSNPRGVRCPTCDAAPGERCHFMSRPAANKQGWAYTGIQRAYKRFYCATRWAVLNGAELDAAESAAESGLWAADAHESATNTGLLAEADDGNDQMVLEPIEPMWGPSVMEDILNARSAMQNWGVN